MDMFISLAVAFDVSNLVLEKHGGNGEAVVARTDEHLLFFHEGHNFHGAPRAWRYLFQFLIFDEDILAVVVFITSNHFRALHIAFASGAKERLA